MPAGHQTAQVAHAVADFAFKKPEAFQEWHLKSQFVVVLQARDTHHLEALRVKAETQALLVIPFHEPDLAGELTSLAFVPHTANKSFLSNLPLAGKNLPTTL